jgi:hypothetical protein
MTALAEIKKKQQRQEPQPRNRKPRTVDKSRPSEPYNSTPVQLIRELVRLHELHGVSYRRAYFRVFPDRKAKERSAGEIAKRLIERYKTQYAEDLQEMLRLHGLNEERLVVEMDQRLKSNTLHDIVLSKIVQIKTKDGRKKPYVVTVRNTEQIEDNSTRMRATELLADVHGARKLSETGEARQNVAIIYVVGGKIVKKRQERIA